MTHRLLWLFLAWGLSACSMSPEMRRDVFGFDPASEKVDWSPFTNPSNLGLPDKAPLSCQNAPARVVTTNGVEDEYRYNDCQNQGPTHNPQRYGKPDPDNLENHD